LKTMNNLKWPTASMKRLVTIAVVFVAVLLVYSSQAKAATYSGAAGKTRLESMLPGDDGSLPTALDQRCATNLAANHVLGGWPTTRVMINGSATGYEPSDYGYGTWISPDNDPSAGNTVTVPYGTTDINITLQLNMFQFMCFPVSEGSPYPSDPNNVANHDNLVSNLSAANFPEDEPPVPDNGTIYAASLMNRIFYVKSTTFSPAADATLASGPPSTTSTPRDNNSRYWFNAHDPFTITVHRAVLPPGVTTTINADVEGQLISVFHNAGDIYCTSPTGAYIGPITRSSQYAGCAVYPNNYSINLNFLPNPNKFTHSVTASCNGDTLSGAAQENLNGTTAAQQLRIDVYEGGVVPGTDRQYTTHTSGATHSFDIPISTDIVPGNTQASGIYNPYPSPLVGTPPAGGANAHPNAGPNGGSTDWTNQTFTVYAVGVNAGDTGEDNTYTIHQTVTLGPCAAITCGTENLPATMPTNDPVTFDVTVNAANVSTPPPPPIPAFNAKVGIQVFTPAYSTFTAGSPAILTSANSTFTPPTPGTYPVSWGWADAGHTLTNAATNCGAGSSVTVSNEPYVSVLGGDVEAGSAFGSADCTNPPKNDGIIGYNQNSGNYIGSGTQLAAEALGQIDGFASQQSGPSPPTALSLANTVAVNLPTDYYGGDFGYASCPPTINTSGSTTLLNPTVKMSALILGSGAGTGGNYVISGNITLVGDVKIPAGVKIQLYVKEAGGPNSSNIYIPSSIQYVTNGSWTGPSAIPSLTVVSYGGSIFIDPSATQLDGTYIDQPDKLANGGTIYDCSTAALAGTYAGSSCNNTLVVNGAFIANQIKYERLNSNIFGIGANPPTPAEQFNYGPEEWLDSSSSALPTNYDSITTLPPVL